MGKPAAYLGAFHACPAFNGPVAHVGGPTLAASPNVFVGGLPIARLTDKLVCVGPPDVIVQGSATVFANGLPVARLGDSTAHGGKIVVGNPTVLVGG
ncbi:MAG: PAAR domain-containing protein [Pseudomonadales bacterium]|uniref:PAAR domain-containing protein n=1 Tax=Marinobacter xestospongiae TaxID=994319 RepID=UPI002002A7BB|nr:PAAR domain-containing protein [Marinobacter xestospongiae]MCG8518555.1 PAAR domain-containing protein [Pseudomonadales bacterium]MCK7567126.1 PAAR domain-containing protein [Marinobacter xestospongiae]